MIIPKGCIENSCGNRDAIDSLFAYASHGCFRPVNLKENKENVAHFRGESFPVLEKFYKMEEIF